MYLLKTRDFSHRIIRSNLYFYRYFLIYFLYIVICSGSDIKVMEKKDVLLRVLNNKKLIEETK